MDLTLNPRLLFRILRRRKWVFLLPAALISVAAVAMAFLLPPVYRSEGTILIESQNIPEDIVPSLVTDYIDRRLDTLTRRAILPDNLLNMVTRYDLYPEEREALSRTELAELMAEDVRTRVLSTTVNDPRSGQTSEVTVAFEVGFDYRDPEKARDVANDLVSFYLSTNLETRRDLATQTTTFFANERDSIEGRIEQLEDELAAFNLENRELLPEEAVFSRQLLTNAEQQLQLLDRDIRSLRERDGFLTAELALTDEFDNRVLPGDSSATPEGQLDFLRAELATARARYTANHPDVVRLEREVRSLQAVVGDQTTTAGLFEQEALLTTEFSALRERYTAEHPDVVRVQQQLDGVRRAIATAQANGQSSGGSRGLVRNPAYIQLSAQLNSVRTQLTATEQQRAEVLAERERLQSILARAPVVEREYTRLVRELESAIADRDVLADKEAQIQLSSAMETEAISEQLVLAEPPIVPTDPVRPNKRLILALGLVLAMGAGGASVAMAEILDRSVRSAEDLRGLVGEMPLVSVPTIISPLDRRRLYIKRAAVVGLAVAAGLGLLVWVNATLVPLDVLGYQTTRWTSDWMTRTFPGMGGVE